MLPLDSMSGHIFLIDLNGIHYYVIFMIPYVLRSPLWSCKPGFLGLPTVILASRIISFLNKVNTLQRKRKHEKALADLQEKYITFYIGKKLANCKQ